MGVSLSKHYLIVVPSPSRARTLIEDYIIRMLLSQNNTFTMEGGLLYQVVNVSSQRIITLTTIPRSTWSIHRSWISDPDAGNLLGLSHCVMSSFCPVCRAAGHADPR